MRSILVLRKLGWIESVYCSSLIPGGRFCKGWEPFSSNAIMAVHRIRAVRIRLDCHVTRTFSRLS
jgi:hypothetical protein